MNDCNYNFLTFFAKILETLHALIEELFNLASSCPKYWKAISSPPVLSLLVRDLNEKDAEKIFSVGLFFKQKQQYLSQLYMLNINELKQLLTEIEALRKKMLE